MQTWYLNLRKPELNVAIDFIRAQGLRYSLPIPKNPRSKNFKLTLFKEDDAVLVQAYVLA